MAIIFRIIGLWWRKRQRAIDVRFLWPEIMARSASMKIARQAFVEHVAYDLAWTEDFTYSEIVAYVDRL